MQFDTILLSFNSDTRQRAIKAFLSGDYSEQKQFLKMLNFTKKIDLREVAFLRKYAKYQESKYLPILEKYFGVANSLFEEMQKEL